MNMISRKHATGSATAALITKVINDEKDGRRRQFAFAEFEKGSVFVHLSVFVDFLLEKDKNFALHAGDIIDLDYEVQVGPRGEQRRATEITAHSAGEILEGKVTRVHPKGFGFIQADAKHSLGKSVFVPHHIVKTLGLEGGEFVSFSYRTNEQGFNAVWVGVEGDKLAMPTLVYDGNADIMEFGGDTSRTGSPAEAKARKAEKSLRDQKLREKMKGS